MQLLIPHIQLWSRIRRRVSDWMAVVKRIGNWSALTGPQAVEREVSGDSQKPRANLQRLNLLICVLRTNGSNGSNEGVLSHLLGIAEIANHRERIGIDTVLMGYHQLFNGPFISAMNTDEQVVYYCDRHQAHSRCTVCYAQ